jgi:hypothetical protein
MSRATGRTGVDTTLEARIMTPHYTDSYAPFPSNALVPAADRHHQVSQHLMKRQGWPCRFRVRRQPCAPVPAERRTMKPRGDGGGTGSCVRRSRAQCLGPGFFGRRTTPACRVRRRVECPVRGLSRREDDRKHTCRSLWRCAASHLWWQWADRPGEALESCPYADLFAR